MTNRIPPSLKWLVDKRSRAHGELIKIEKERDVYLSWITRQLEKLKADLEAIDRTLSLHEIRVRPQFIPPCRSTINCEQLKHGELTKFILECIKKSKKRSATSKEILLYVSAKASLNLDKSITPQSMKDSVRFRIKNLCAKGRLERLPKVKGSYRSYKLKV